MIQVQTVTFVSGDSLTVGKKGTVSLEIHTEGVVARTAEEFYDGSDWTMFPWHTIVFVKGTDE
jgi:hypothetical protein